MLITILFAIAVGSVRRTNGEVRPLEDRMMGPSSFLPIGDGINEPRLISNPGSSEGRTHPVLPIRRPAEINIEWQLSLTKDPKDRESMQRIEAAPGTILNFEWENQHNVYLLNDCSGQWDDFVCPSNQEEWDRGLKLGETSPVSYAIPPTMVAGESLCFACSVGSQCNLGLHLTVTIEGVVPMVLTPTPTAEPEPRPVISPAPTATPEPLPFPSPEPALLTPMPTAEPAPLPADVVLCEGFPAEDYCDCAMDCFDAPQLCGCAAAQECCGAIPPNIVEPDRPEPVTPEPTAYAVQSPAPTAEPEPLPFPSPEPALLTPMPTAEPKLPPNPIDPIDSTPAPLPADVVLCEGFPTEDYCDCQDDCTENEQLCGCAEAQACCSEIEPAPLPADVVLCEGFPRDDYCDCAGDCTENEQLCGCAEAQACCSSEPVVDPTPAPLPATFVLCEGNPQEEYCDCAADCFEQPSFCGCAAAQECCSGNPVPPNIVDPDRPEPVTPEPTASAGVVGTPAPTPVEVEMTPAPTKASGGGSHHRRSRRGGRRHGGDNGGRRRRNGGGGDRRRRDRGHVERVKITVNKRRRRTSNAERRRRLLDISSPRVPVSRFETLPEKLPEPVDPMPGVPETLPAVDLEPETLPEIETPEILPAVDNRPETLPITLEPVGDLVQCPGSPTKCNCNNDCFLMDMRCACAEAMECCGMEPEPEATPAPTEEVEEAVCDGQCDCGNDCFLKDMRCACAEGMECCAGAIDMTPAPTPMMTMIPGEDVKCPGSPQICNCESDCFLMDMRCACPEAMKCCGLDVTPAPTKSSDSGGGRHRRRRRRGGRRGDGHHHRRHRRRRRRGGRRGHHDNNHPSSEEL